MSWLEEKIDDAVDFVVSPIKHVADIGKNIAEEVDDTLLGGSEEEAAQKTEQAARESRDMWNQYRARADERYSPYERLGPENIDIYRAAALDKSSPPVPDYPRQGAFEYGGDIPTFNDAGNIPDYGGSPQFDFDPTAITENPDYQFRLNQGIEAINRGAGAAGKRLSGNRLIDLMEFGQGLASTELGNAFSRALQSSQENQGRRLTDYDITRMNEADRYGRGLNLYDISRGVEADRYGRRVGEYGLEGQRLGREFAGDMTVSGERYNREQERLNRIAELVNMGYSATAARDIADRSATSGASGATIDIGNAQAAGELGKTAARRNLFSDALMFAGSGGFGGGGAAPTPATRWV